MECLCYVLHNTEGYSNKITNYLKKLDSMSNSHSHTSDEVLLDIPYEKKFNVLVSNLLI